MKKVYRNKAEKQRMYRLRKKQKKQKQYAVEEAQQRAIRLNVPEPIARLEVPPPTDLELNDTNFQIVIDYFDKTYGSSNPLYAWKCQSCRTLNHIFYSHCRECDLPIDDAAFERQMRFLEVRPQYEKWVVWYRERIQELIDRNKQQLKNRTVVKNNV